LGRAAAASDAAPAGGLSAASATSARDA